MWDSFCDGPPPLVVLAACHSITVGQDLVAAGVRHVVATTEEVRTGAAMAFTRRFYTELVMGASVEDAFAGALAAISDAHERRILALLPVGGDHSVRPSCCVVASPPFTIFLCAK